MSEDSPAGFQNMDSMLAKPPKLEPPTLYINYDTSDVNPRIHKVFTDGSASKNGKPGAKGAYAAIFVSGPYKDKYLYKRLPTSSTPDSNIRAEGWAIIKSLKETRKDMDCWDSCFIYSDSQFWKDMVEKYMPRWKESDFLKKKNSDMTVKLWKLWNDLKTAGKSLEIIFVPAHNKGGGRDSSDKYKKWAYDNNNAVDILATWTRENLVK